MNGIRGGHVADGDALIRSVEAAYPPELREAMTRRGEELRPQAFAAVAAAAGLPDVTVARVHGEHVVWSRVEEDGSVQRGCITYEAYAEAVA